MLTRYDKFLSPPPSLCHQPSSIFHLAFTPLQKSRRRPRSWLHRRRQTRFVATSYINVLRLLPIHIAAIPLIYSRTTLNTKLKIKTRQPQKIPSLPSPSVTSPTAPE